MTKRQKTTRFSIKDFDTAHYRITEQYATAVDNLFAIATREIASAASKADFNPDKPFSFDDYPKVKAAMQKTIAGLAKKVQSVVETGSRKQWLFSCRKNDAFIKSIFDTSKLKKSELKQMTDKRLDALAAFQGRKVAGMNLSQRVWKYTTQFREQIEHALDVGLGEGRSAQELSRDVRQNLNDPNRLFRRVRDKRGNLVLSKAAQAFHPGQGVYRSSYKNAMRLTRSEINMAYRESDYQRWQALDFVVGFEIMRSNHEPLCKCSICEKLVGRYPKTFKFVGWHPQCMCFAIPIIEDFFSEGRRNDRVNRLKAALKGTEAKKYVSPETIDKLPEGFNEWVNAHKEVQKGWRSTPYFIRDNFKNGSLADGLKIKMPDVVKVDPLAAIMPQITNARQLATQWGLTIQLKMLEKYVAEKDVSHIQSTVATIQSKVSIISQADKDIRSKCAKWGLSIYILDQAMNTHDSRQILNAQAELETRCIDAEKEYNAYLVDARKAISDAKANKIDSSGVEGDVNAVSSDVREWIMGKVNIKQRLTDLLSKINKALSGSIPTPPDDVEEDLNVGNVAIVSPKAPSVSYTHDDKKKTFEERAKNYADALTALYGSKDNCHLGYKAWWQSVKDNYSKYKGVPLKLDTYVIRAINGVIDGGLGEYLDAIAHLGELSTAKNLGNIPMKWRTIFNGYIKKIESADVANEGYISVYREIEAAYNIYQLSTSKMATSYGLGKISPKMPYQFFEEMKKKLKIDITQTMPRKAFFDSLEEYVPLSTVGKRNDGCYFSPTFKHVRMPWNIKKTKERFIDSPEYRTKIIYHEFGHARDGLSPTGEWVSRKEWKDLFSTFEKEIKKDGGAAIEAAIRKKANDLKLAGVDTGDNVEMLGALADTIQSLVKGHRYVWSWGHSVSYWKGDKMLKEFIAHASENYWGGNNLFKELCPDLYREMCKVMKKM